MGVAEAGEGPILSLSLLLSTISKPDDVSLGGVTDLVGVESGVGRSMGGSTVGSGGEDILGYVLFESLIDETFTFTGFKFFDNLLTRP